MIILLTTFHFLNILAAKLKIVAIDYSFTKIPNSVTKAKHFVIKLQNVFVFLPPKNPYHTVL